MRCDPVRLVEYLHPEMDRTYRDEDLYQCHAALLGAWEGSDSMHDKLFPKESFFTEVQKVIGKEDFYFSVNSFYCAQRKTANVRHLNSIVLDYDFYKLDEYKDFTVSEMYHLVQPSLPADPTAVIDSGRGMYIIFAVEHCPYQVTDLYRSVVTALQESQTQYGADPKATLVTQVIRIPGTVNSRSGKTVEIIEFNEVRYPISKLAEKVLPFSKDEVSQWKSKKINRTAKSSAKVYRQSKFEKDLQQLIKIRNEAGILTGYREQAIYLYWESLLWNDSSDDVIRKKVVQMNSLFRCPLTDQELYKQCKPARKYEFRTSKAKIIAKLSITADEMKSMKYLVSSNVHRKKLMRKSRRFMGETEKEKKLKIRREEVIRLLGVKKIGEMADLFGVSPKTILRDLKYIADHLAQFQKVLREVMKRSIRKATDFIQQVVDLTCDTSWSGLPEIWWKKGEFAFLY